MNRFYLIKNSHINLRFVSNLLKPCNGESGLLVSIYNCIFQELMLEGNRKHVAHRQILLQVTQAKTNILKAVQKVLKDLEVVEIIDEHSQNNEVEKHLFEKNNIVELLDFNIRLQCKILAMLGDAINECESLEHLRILKCAYKIEQNNEDLLVGLKKIKCKKK